MPVRLIIEDGPFAGVARSRIARRASAILRTAARSPRAELSLVLTGDDRIRELNRIYRKKNKPTDVLAFAQREGAHARAADRLLGDVIVSVPTARKQADGAGQPLLAELTMLISHGVLHLLGWDHDTPSKDRRMRAETQRLCAAADRADRPRKATSMARATKKPQPRSTTRPR